MLKSLDIHIKIIRHTVSTSLHISLLFDMAKNAYQLIFNPLLLELFPDMSLHCCHITKNKRRKMHQTM